MIGFMICLSLVILLILALGTVVVTMLALVFRALWRRRHWIMGGPTVPERPGRARYQAAEQLALQVKGGRR